MTAKVFKIASTSTLGKFYNVVLDTKGFWHCQCFPYLRTGNCKHIEEAKAKNTP